MLRGTASIGEETVFALASGIVRQNCRRGPPLAMRQTHTLFKARPSQRKGRRKGLGRALREETLSGPAACLRRWWLSARHPPRFKARLFKWGCAESALGLQY